MSEEKKSRECPELAFGDLHQKLLSGLGKEDMIKGYDEWSTYYEEQCAQHKSEYKRKSAEFLLDYAEKTERPIRILDAGCGTGVPGMHLTAISSKKGIEIELIGTDFSTKMLTLSKKRNVYSELVEADVNEKLPFPDGHFDAFLAIGLFVDRHCEPSLLKNISRCVRKGGIGVITVRQNTYEANEEMYQEAFKDADFSVKDEILTEYIQDHDAYYFILQRK